jgi:hypothetical protein
MIHRASGILKKNTVVLDEPLPELDGCRVEVELHRTSDVEGPGATELLDAWNAWAAGNNQGPIRDEPEQWP